MRQILFLLTLILTSLSVGDCFAATADEKLLSQLDYAQPQLHKVQQQYQQRHTDKALAQLLQHFRSKENLYLKLSDQDSDYLTAEFVAESENSVRIADRIINKNFLFDHKWDMERSYIPHQFEGEIDWGFIPQGDIEWPYMLNRHRYWQELGRAYLLTGNEKYAKTFVEHATHWIENNPLLKNGQSVVWRRIEAGMRAEYWIKTFEYFKQSKQLTPKFLGLFLTSLIQHAEYITENFSNFSQRSNWGVIEFHGLFNISQFLSEFKPAQQWQQRSLAALVTTLEVQVLADGNHWERSPMYHNAVLSNYMNVMLLAKRRNISLPKIFSEKTRAMLNANIKWQKPNLRQPTFGDSDDTDLTDVLAFGASLFNDPVMKSRTTPELGYDELFSLGHKRAQSYEKIKAKLPAFTSSFLASSGDVYFRSSWREDASYSSFHMKNVGAGQGHGHDDLLHFGLYANQRDYLVDSGRYNYVGNKWRRYFKGNKSHNTLGVDDLPNSIYKNAWANKFEARSQGVFTKLSAGFDYAEAENLAYQRLADPVSMKRRLLFLKDNVWVVFDSFQAKGKHKYSQYFNFPNKKVVIKNKILTTTYDTDNLSIVPVNPVDMTLEGAWASTDYNEKHQSLTAEVSRKSTGFTSFISLLYFPDKTKLTYQKVPVFSLRGAQLKEKDVEAIRLFIDGKEYIVMVAHNSPRPSENLFVVQDQIVHGEVVLLEKTDQSYTITIIKE